MKRKNRFALDLTTPFDAFKGTQILRTDFRDQDLWRDDAELHALTGKTYTELSSVDSTAELTAEQKAVLLEYASSKLKESAIDTLKRYEREFAVIFRTDDAVANAIKILVTIAFNCGTLAGSVDRTSREDNLNRGKEMRALDSAERNRKLALERRRAIGEPTRQRAREAMKRKPHLSWTACANEIAEGRDGRGVARVIEELFPKGNDGKRRYIGDNPPERPDLSGETP